MEESREVLGGIGIYEFAGSGERETKWWRWRWRCGMRGGRKRGERDRCGVRRGNRRVQERGKEQREKWERGVRLYDELSPQLLARVRKVKKMDVRC